MVFHTPYTCCQSTDRPYGIFSLSCNVYGCLKGKGKLTCWHPAAFLIEDHSRISLCWYNFYQFSLRKVYCNLQLQMSQHAKCSFDIAHILHCILQSLQQSHCNLWVDFDIFGFDFMNPIWVISWLVMGESP